MKLEKNQILLFYKNLFADISVLKIICDIISSIITNKMKRKHVQAKLPKAEK